jgi:hypothetical protein
LPGFNDLGTTDPDLAAQAVGWDPIAVTRGAHQMRRWQCALGHQWNSLVSNRAVHGKGCPICSGRQALAGFNDLATTDPAVAAQSFGWDPATVTRSSNKRLEWECDLGHLWVSTVAGRTRGFGCPFCTGKSALKGFNDLATTHPDIAAQACGWDPATVTRGSDRRRRWKCAEGHEWTTAVANRVGGKGCPACASHGFDGNTPAWLYLMKHAGFNIMQIGITNSPTSRLKKHEKRGWVLLETEGPMDGELARNHESAILKMLKASSARMAPFEGIDKFDGYTECWMKGSNPAGTIAALRAASHQMG